MEQHCVWDLFMNFFFVIFCIYLMSINIFFLDQTYIMHVLLILVFIKES